MPPMSATPSANAPNLSLPLEETRAVEAALNRNAVERRLLNRLLKLCWVRDHESKRLAGSRHQSDGAPADRVG